LKDLAVRSRVQVSAGLVVMRLLTAAIWEGEVFEPGDGGFRFYRGFSFLDLDAGHGGLPFALRAGRSLKLGTERADDAALEVCPGGVGRDPVIV
jgi:hypothetical protein